MIFFSSKFDGELNSLRTYHLLLLLRDGIVENICQYSRSGTESQGQGYYKKS